MDESEVVRVSGGRSTGFTAGSVPEAYDRFMASQLFEPWARELLCRAELRSGTSVLDVASGPGTVARLAAAVVGPEGRVVASDISPALRFEGGLQSLEQAVDDLPEVVQLITWALEGEPLAEAVLGDVPRRVGDRAQSPDLTPAVRGRHSQPDK